MTFKSSDLYLLLGALGLLLLLNLVEQWLAFMQRVAAATFATQSLFTALVFSDLLAAVLFLGLGWYAATRRGINMLVAVVLLVVGVVILFAPLLSNLLGLNLLSVGRFLWFPATRFSLAAAFVATVGVFALLFRRPSP